MPRPLHYLNNLLDLEVPLDASIVGGSSAVNPHVKIRRYHNMKQKSWPGSFLRKEALQRALQADLSPPKSIGGIPLLPNMLDHINIVHMGLGSATEIRAVLQLTAHYASVPSKTKIFTYLPTPSAATIGKELQDYCDNYLGLCCVGFAIGFAKDRMGKRFLLPLATTSFIHLPATSLDMVLEENVMVWAYVKGQSKSHMAVIDRKTMTGSNKAHVTIAESIGEGWPPRGPTTDYGELEYDSGDVFKYTSHTHVTKTNWVSIAAL